MTDDCFLCGETIVSSTDAFYQTEGDVLVHLDCSDPEGSCFEDHGGPYLPSMLGDAYPAQAARMILADRMTQVGRHLAAADRAGDLVLHYGFAPAEALDVAYAEADATVAWVAGS